ncbi:MAG: hypothetical protein PHT60_11640 [Acidiphilium sp.]|nr:hypothetical protein [Acidiphilium sp.]MDD4936415.1 hypothetical protein [Acidiphilium sp.]
MANWYNTETRDEWQDQINSLRSVSAGVECLQSFRADHTGPDRKTYDLKKEVTWIESRIEMRLGQLHSEELISDEDLLSKTIDGKCAKEVVGEWVKKAADIDCKIKMEGLCIAYRKACKPPMVPINYFAAGEKILISKLMRLRAIGALDQTVEELREMRGVTRLSVQ